MTIEPVGFVYLVGGGPGDPGLITLRGIECLKKAEVVIHDRLVSRALLAYVHQAEVIDVGKQPDRHTMTQSKINALLVEKAKEGKVVVRLKGGDPFVFGRGGEEAQALFEEGIPFEIIPGVTSAVSAPAYAGIPITHRGLACSTAVITGHRADCTEEPGESWKRLACAVDTLVFLMGVQNLPIIISQLIAGGRKPDTPVAIIEQATTAAQNTVVGTLENIVERASQVHPPAVIVVGEVVNLREELRWFDRIENRPLLGLRVLNTRPVLEDRINPHSGLDEFSHRLADLGAYPIDFPTTGVIPALDQAPLDVVVQKLAARHHIQPAFDEIIFSNPDSVSFFIEHLLSSGLDVRSLANIRLGVVGRASANVLRRYGLSPDFELSHSAFPKLPKPVFEAACRRLLVLHSGEAPPESLSHFSFPNIIVENVSVCSARPAQPDPEVLTALLNGGIDVVTFFTPSAVHGLASMLVDFQLADVLSSIKVVCMGPMTAQAAQDYGIKVDLTATEHSVQGMCQALLDLYRKVSIN